jgi:hypothetical protein
VEIVIREAEPWGIGNAAQYRAVQPIGRVETALQKLDAVTTNCGIGMRNVRLGTESGAAEDCQIELVRFGQQTLVIVEDVGASARSPHRRSHSLLPEGSRQPGHPSIGP